MPTPVGVARQCLADAAAAVLDDAVAVAKRRGHAQTTSLHAVSALLALPAANTLREACTRARSSAYSPRLQFRALELCIGVALDRISAAKSAVEEAPPVSNSLMAAIKRSQANQRRHPETFHLYQQQQLMSSNSASISAVKVELKHFVMSILDDPIVSRVFDDAGFRTHEIKLAILNPLSMSRFAYPNCRPPPLFLCSLRDFEMNKLSPNFDDNSRRIGEILLGRSRRNPLLIGACAGDAYRNFIDPLKRGEAEALPREIDGLKVISIEQEISQFFDGDGVSSEDSIRMKLQQVDELVEDGVIVTCGDMKVLAGVESVDAADFIVSGLKNLLTKPGARLWLIGFLASDDDYSKLVKQFPSIEKDWDLHMLPITSSLAGNRFKSSLMRSFVPFGGLFPMPSELESPHSITNQPSKLCKLCNEKCEQEVNAVRNGQSIDSVTKKQSVNLSSSLEIAECETSKRSHTLEAKEDKTLLDARVLGLARKWSEICQRLHSSQRSQGDNNQSKPHPSVPSFQNISVWKDATGMGTLSNGSSSNSSLCTVSDLHEKPVADHNIYKKPVADHNIYRPVVLRAGTSAQSGIPLQGLKSNYLQRSSDSQQTTHVVSCMSSPSVLKVTTDLRLGTFYDSAVERGKEADFPQHHSTQNPGSSGSHEKLSSQISESILCSKNLEKYPYIKDLEHQWKVLAEKVYWQVEAIRAICRTVSSCRNGSEKYHFLNNGNVWLGFTGPDKAGKRKIAASVAEIVYGANKHLLCLDVNTQDVSCDVNSVVYSCGSDRRLKSGRKMIVDHLADELRKHPHCVVLLENVEKADFLVRRSLLRAIETGKFPDSYGRDININNNLLILASGPQTSSSDPPLGHKKIEFSEEKILEAKNFQMQISVEPARGIARTNSSTNVLIAQSNQCHTRKRKLEINPAKEEMSKRACSFPRSIIDLNLPVGEEDTEENEDSKDSSDNPEMWLEELLEQVHENVVFKPFDFDSLSQRIVKQIDTQLKKSIGSKTLLEIHQNVMVQILAAAWLTDNENALEDWIEQVLCTGIQKAHEKHDPDNDWVMKLLPCDALAVESKAAGICLPARINLQ